MEKATLGKRIREARQKRGYTQHTLAEKAGIGDVYMGEIERGSKMPSLNIFVALINALDISADYVLRDELASGQSFVFDEITDRLKNLTPRQRKTAVDIIDAYLRNL